MPAHQNRQPDPNSSRPQPAIPTPGPLSKQLREAIGIWSRQQHRLVKLAVEFADSDEWLIAGSQTAAHWLATAADVETSTAREWIRIGRRLAELPAVSDAFDDGRLSYAKVRALTRIASASNEAALVGVAESVPASCVRRAVATWIAANSDPDELARHQRRQRSLRWRNEPDGMVTLTAHLEPHIAAKLTSLLNGIVMRSWLTTTGSGQDASADAPASLAQQRADALEILLDQGSGTIETEVILHVRGEGTFLDDGTPIPETVVERIAPTAFLRALIHDANGRPINASKRQRHPTTRQKRVVKERDRCCVDCGSHDVLHYDHRPSYEETGHTIVEELELRCARCHRQRHQEAS